MYAGRVGDLTEQFVLRRVDDDDLGRVRNVQTLGRAVDAQIVPPALAADVNVFDEPIRFVRGTGTGRQKETHRQAAHRDSLDAHETSNRTYALIA